MLCPFYLVSKYFVGEGDQSLSYAIRPQTAVWHISIRSIAAANPKCNKRKIIQRPKISTCHSIKWTFIGSWSTDNNGTDD